MRDYIQFKGKSVKGDEAIFLIKGNTNEIILTELIKAGIEKQPSKNKIVYKDSLVIDNVNYLKNLLILYFQESMPNYLFEEHSEFITDDISLIVFDLLNKKRLSMDDTLTISLEFGLEFPKPINLDYIEKKCACLNNAKEPKFNIIYVQQTKNTIEKSKKCSHLSMKIQLL